MDEQTLMWLADPIDQGIQDGLGNAGCVPKENNAHIFSMQSIKYP